MMQQSNAIAELPTSPRDTSEPQSPRGRHRRATILSTKRTVDLKKNYDGNYINMLSINGINYTSNNATIKTMNTTIDHSLDREQKSANIEITDQFLKVLQDNQNKVEGKSSSSSSSASSSPLLERCHRSPEPESSAYQSSTIVPRLNIHRRVQTRTEPEEENKERSPRKADFYYESDEE